MSKYHFEPKEHVIQLSKIAREALLLGETVTSEKAFVKILKKYPKSNGRLFRKDELLAGFGYLKSEKLEVRSGKAQSTKHQAPRSERTWLRRGYARRAKKILKQVQYQDNPSTSSGQITNQEFEQLKKFLQLKPTRTISGVTTVTVLTKPFPCQGECIFCPNDVRMPKSYIATEPGAQRALQNRFSPYLQTWNRLQALKNIGHPTSKIELLVLGGTWSNYSDKYKIWFISECFRAMNNFGKAQSTKHKVPIDKKQIPNHKLQNSEQYSRDEAGYLYEDKKLQIDRYLESDWNDELRARVGNLSYNKLIRTKEFEESFNQFICSEESALRPSEALVELKKLHEINSKSNCKCVGLVLETRPDCINPREALRLRQLGATKIQLGIQTLDDEVSKMNKRGEGRVETSRAFNLLRAAGFKIHAHMMPNLYGATPKLDLQVYKDLFQDENYKPDEVKIYPTSIIKNTELYDLFEQGKYKPYSTETLVDLIASMMEETPEYCRLTRIIRDIPSTEIEAGNKTTNLREVVEHKLKSSWRKNPNIRAREVKSLKVEASDLVLDKIEFETKYTNEVFLQFITKDRKIAGFLRLSLPKSLNNLITNELNDCAMIREVHVYGPSLKFSTESEGEAQHLGLGTKLIQIAKDISRKNDFKKLAVISAIGTREYYEKRGFNLVDNYQICEL